MKDTDEINNAAVAGLIGFAVVMLFASCAIGFIAGENYGRQREYWRIAAKCPAIVKEVPEK
jgi:hypothetical protein